MQKCRRLELGPQPFSPKGIRTEEHYLLDAEMTLQGLLGLTIHPRAS